MLPLLFDMETNDPDDYLTLLLLLGHPEVDLRGVTLMPGSAMQVGLIRRTLEQFERDIPVGASRLDHPKPCVSSWHEQAYGKITPSHDAEPAEELLHRKCNEDVTLVTGAAMKNLGRTMKMPGFRLGRLVAQGGFAGDGIVPEAWQLEKFRGQRTCPSFNLNGDPKTALAVQQDDNISKRYFVSKNVCHGVVYDERMHDQIAPFRGHSQSLRMIWQGMDAYLRKASKKRPQRLLVNEEIRVANQVLVTTENGRWIGLMDVPLAIKHARDQELALVLVAPRANPPVCQLREKPPVELIEFERRPVKARIPNNSESAASRSEEPFGKKLHDPLAACCAINPEIGQWEEVELYRERGEWGSRLSPGSKTWIIVRYDHQRFVETLTATTSN